jgi:hypothetical protein
MSKAVPRLTRACQHCGGAFQITAARIASGGGKYCSRLCGNRAICRRHGHTTKTSQSPTYKSWSSMRSRCERPEVAKYEHYGGRGIKVCAQWQAFAGFLVDMGERPEGHTLDRIDVNGNYEPGNCRWATKAQQTYNTRQTHWVEYGGERCCLTELARDLGLAPTLLESRVRRGWPEWRWSQPSDKRIQIRRTRKHP